MIINFKSQTRTVGPYLSLQFLLALTLVFWGNMMGIWAQNTPKNYPVTLQEIQKNLDGFKLWYKPGREYQIGLPSGSAAALNDNSLNIPASGQSFLTDLNTLREDWTQMAEVTDYEQLRPLFESFIPKLEALHQATETYAQQVNRSNIELISFTAIVQTNLNDAQKRYDQAKTLYNQGSDRYLEIKSKAIRIPTNLDGNIQLTEDPNYPFTEAEKSEMAGWVINSIQYENELGQYSYFIAENNKLFSTLNGLAAGFNDCLNELAWATTQLEAAQHDAQKALETEDEAVFKVYQHNAAQAMNQFFILL